MNKKDLPIILLQSLNRLNETLLEIAQENNHLIVKSYNEFKLLQFKDIDKTSTFKFELKKVKLTNSGPAYEIELAPCSGSNNNIGKETQNEKSVSARLHNWLNWLEIYADSHLTEEDEILAQYEEEFYDEFEIVDEDASHKAFGLEQQKFLHSYLTESEDKLQKFIGTKDENYDKELEELIEESKRIKSALTRETKKQVVRRISKFWAKGRKIGLEILKELIVQSAVEFGKKLLYIE